MSYRTHAANALPFIQEKGACFLSLHLKSLNIEDMLFDIERAARPKQHQYLSKAVLDDCDISWLPPCMYC